jgi:hypothetical protein
MLVRKFLVLTIAFECNSWIPTIPVCASPPLFFLPLDLSSVLLSSHDSLISRPKHQAWTLLDTWRSMRPLTDQRGVYGSDAKPIGSLALSSASADDLNLLSTQVHL